VGGAGGGITGVCIGKKDWAGWGGKG